MVLRLILHFYHHPSKELQFLKTVLLLYESCVLISGHLLQH